ncbi:MAG: hypothetical protein HYZ81_07995 [Nitrospinae bacterium]|nr:hypothetical protein [Nitrospinota bacterium]
MNLDRNTEQVRKRGTRRLSLVGVHKIKKYLALTLGVSERELTGLAMHTLRRSLAMMLYEREGLGAAQQLIGHKKSCNYSGFFISVQILLDNVIEKRYKEKHGSGRCRH